MTAATRILGTIAAVVAVAALAVPAASAGPQPGPTAQNPYYDRNHPNQNIGGLGNQPDNPIKVGPDNFPGQPRSGTNPSMAQRIIAQENARHLDPRIFGTRPAATAPAVVPVVKVSSGGFDWGDAGIGGAAMFAFVLLLAGGAALWQTSHRQGPQG